MVTYECKIGFYLKRMSSAHVECSCHVHTEVIAIMQE